MCSRRLTFGGIAAAVLLVASSAVAQLDKGAQKCIDQYNNKLRLVSQQAGKSARSCIKNATKGKEANPENCIVANTDGKIAGKEAKVSALYGSKCTGSEPIQQGAAAGNAAHRDAITQLAHDFFGDPVDTFSTDKTDAKCIDKGFQRATQAFTEIIKNHRKCKKNALKAGTVLDSGDLDAVCGTLGQMDPGGKAQAKLAKLTADVGAACAANAGGEEVFDGLDASCHASAAALGTCLETLTKCRACETLNAADGQGINCDMFDNGVDDDSCSEPVVIGSHLCTMNDGGGSSLAITTQALPLNLNASGSVQIECGVVGGDGTAPCSCDVNTFDPVVIPAIGDVCVNPHSGCASGVIDCDGGTAMDVDVQGDHNIGACNTQDACSAACDAHCAGIGVNYAPVAASCEGFCQGGSNEDDACTDDSECTGGTCPGQNPPAHAGVCNCVCGGTGLGAPAAAGNLSCNVGVQINVELPTNGSCGDTVTITLPPQCGAVTTTQSTGGMTNANNTPAKNLTAYGAPATGTATSCAALMSSTTNGFALVGSLGFFDSTLGDIHSGNRFVCN